MIGIPEDFTKALRAFRAFAGMDPPALLAQANLPAPMNKQVEKGVLHLVILLEALEEPKARTRIVAAIDALGCGEPFFNADAVTKQYRRVKNL